MASTTQQFKRGCRKTCLHPVTVLSVLAILSFVFWTSISYFRIEMDDVKYVLDYWYAEQWMTDDTLGEARHLAQRLIELHRKLSHSLDAQRPPGLKNLMELKTLAKRLDPSVDIGHYKSKDTSRVTSNSSNVDSAPSLLRTPVICPEYYYGTRRSSIGWQILNCSTNHTLSELLTVVINLQEFSLEMANKTITTLTQDLNTAYPGTRVIFVADDVLQRDLSRSFLSDSVADMNVVLSQILEDTYTFRTDALQDSFAKSWNEAVKKVETPYVLIARSVLRFSKDSSPLERLLRVLTQVPGVGAVGGALRNSTGHWHSGCFQTSLTNYVLTYQKGYYNSQNESMICDYIDGPFVISTSVLRQNTFDENLETSVLFQDFFLNLSESGAWIFMLCPDVMFYANGNMAGGSRILLRESWLGFARKWELNRILIGFEFSRVLHKYSCSDVGISCKDKIRSTSYYTIPVCCQEELGSALKFWDEFCETYRLEYQIDSGSGLGAVKMADFIPWDIDVDGGYHEMNYTFLKSMAPIFEKNGLNLTNFRDPKCCDRSHPNGLRGSYMQLLSPSMKIEMWADWKYPHDTFLYPNRADKFIETKVELHGIWVKGLPNPGHYVRKRYGKECLKHAQNWSQTGKKNSIQPYEAGHFKKCRNANRHSCLDRFPTDGNIAFLVPN